MRISFNIEFRTKWGQQLYIVGSVPELGGGNSSEAKLMDYANENTWSIDIELPDDTKEITYQYLLAEGDKIVFGERVNAHRMVFDGAIKSFYIYDNWQTDCDNYVFYSSAFQKNIFRHQTETANDTGEIKNLLVCVKAPKLKKTQRLYLSGNQKLLGNWDIKRSLPLNYHGDALWYIYLDANKLDTELEYKFVAIDQESGDSYWDCGENRKKNISYYLKKGEIAIFKESEFRDESPNWRGCGTVVPVFSLRSDGDFGIGDFNDLKQMIDWCVETNQHIIQILPINDTTKTYQKGDSYPYSAISIYALHPIYISLEQLGKLKDTERMAVYEEKRKELNALRYVDYEDVIKWKMNYCREFFAENYKEIESNENFAKFKKNNESWLIPYSAYSYLRDEFETADYNEWGEFKKYNRKKIESFIKSSEKGSSEVEFYQFLQYELNKQLTAAATYARDKEVILKGDLPIGVNKLSVETWTEPEYFNLNSQAGAPPDDFSTTGQNWGFPTYNWERMATDDFDWWKRRFGKLEEYFDAFRIDHILGFFRIWEIPSEYVRGLCGHFNPSLPLSVKEIEEAGLQFHARRFTTPRISKQNLADLFGDDAEYVASTYLVKDGSTHYTLQKQFDTQRKIEAAMESATDDRSKKIKEGLFRICEEVLFLRDAKEKIKFHPRISAYTSYVYKELTDDERFAFDRLYWDFYYHRHNEFWKNTALGRLTPLINETKMLVCGEDLGMIPASVPEVMRQLHILSLDIERMPKSDNAEFEELSKLPYLSVCSPSTHDMSPIREWWHEDKNKTEAYYKKVLGLHGETPADCSAITAERIVYGNLCAPSMLSIIPLQDWFAIDDSTRVPEGESERINIPADPNHYWRYRSHISIDDIRANTSLNNKIRGMISSSRCV